jgi:hypothetical protein
MSTGGLTVSQKLFTKVEEKPARPFTEPIVWLARTLYLVKPGGHTFSVALGCVPFIFWFCFHYQVAQGTCPFPS